jgi:hypothetical protein
MKSIFTFLVAVLLTASVFAQSPEKMSYQAVVRDLSNNLVTNQAVGMKISILQGSISGTSVYEEIYNPNPTTNANGLVTVEIGGGVPLSGTFSTIDWSAGPYFIKTETDPTGGTNYTITGVSQLLSVPYALHSKTAETITGGLTETDPIFVASPANGITSGDIMNWNNKLDAESQILSISNDTIYLTGGSFVKLPAGFSGDYNDLTNQPTIPTVPTNVSAFTNDAGYLTSFTESQILSISNDTIYLTGGSFVKLPAGFSGDYNDLTNQPTIPTVPTNVSAFTNDAGYLTSFTESQILSISNDTIYLTGGSFVKLPAGFSGDYNDLINQPTIPTVPTNVSAFTNDAGYLTSFTESQILSISNDTIYLTGGSFVKLPAGFSGDYNDLTNQPTIPTVPTNVSAFTNDAGYVTTDSLNLSINGNDLSISGGNTVTLPSGGSSGGFQIFSASGTFTVPEGVTQIIVEVWGAGGGGGRLDGGTGGGGGGGGGYGKGFFDVIPATTYSITIGQGGSGATTSGGAGNTGGTTLFGALISATGGVGGASSAGGAGGTSAALINNNGFNGSSAPSHIPGSGGRGGGFISSSYCTGGGGANNSIGYGAVGGTGGNGYCIVYW